MSIFQKRSLREFRGFTLVELLVVIAIIGILATLLLLQLGVARGKARDTKRIADVNQLRSAIEQYFDDNTAKYPTTLTLGVGGTLTKYFTVNVMPTDPLTAAAYGYAFDPLVSPIKYQMWTHLENKSAALSSDADIDSTTWAGGTKTNGATETCPTPYVAAANNCVFDLGQN